MFTASQEAKKAGFFSRRNRTSAAHDNAHRAHEEKRATKIQNAQKRSVGAANRTPREKLSRLNERLGVGVGAKKERERLINAIIANNKD